MRLTMTMRSMSPTRCSLRMLTPVTDDARWHYNDEVGLFCIPTNPVRSCVRLVTNGVVGTNGVSSEGVRNAVVKRVSVRLSKWPFLDHHRRTRSKVGDKWGIHFSGYQTIRRCGCPSSQATSFLRPEMMASPCSASNRR